MESLIAQIIGDTAVVLVVSFIMGAAARRCGQPSVVGQILAGILLGPSLLGRLPGHLTGRLFPHPVLPVLTALGQIAVVMFMFLVGYELDRRPLRGLSRAVLAVAASALVIPLSIGCGLAAGFGQVFADVGQAHPGRPFILFIGVIMSITALPVLAAIVRERGIAGTPAGVTALAAAGIMDVLAWLLLAVPVAATSAHAGRPWPVTLLLVTCFTAVMLLAVRPLLRWGLGRRQALLVSQVPLALALALGSAWVTASLGLHPVFGGFLAGLTMPRLDGVPAAGLLRSLADVSGLLLPLFFAVSGLSVNIGALTGSAWILLAVVCLLASVGKLVPAYTAGRVAGLSASDAATVAALVNTRGLTELIALNVGLSAGLIGTRLFSVFVLMALLMTMATGPLLWLVRTRPPATADHDRVEIAQM